MVAHCASSARNALPRPSRLGLVSVRTWLGVVKWVSLSPLRPQAAGLAWVGILLLPCCCDAEVEQGANPEGRPSLKWSGPRLRLLVDIDQGAAKALGKKGNERSGTEPDRTARPAEAGPKARGDRDFVRVAEGHVRSRLVEYGFTLVSKDRIDKIRGDDVLAAQLRGRKATVIAAILRSEGADVAVLGTAEAGANEIGFSVGDGGDGATGFFKGWCKIHLEAYGGASMVADGKCSIPRKGKAEAPTKSSKRRAVLEAAERCAVLAVDELLRNWPGKKRAVTIVLEGVPYAASRELYGCVTAFARDRGGRDVSPFKWAEHRSEFQLTFEGESGDLADTLLKNESGRELELKEVSFSRITLVKDED